MVRGSVSAALAGLCLQGCFSAGFLADTCERLPGGCGGGSSSTGGSSSSGVVPTTGGSSSTGGDSSSGTTGESLGVKFDGPAFRIDTMTLVDPHAYIDPMLCLDATKFLNDGVKTSIGSHETNLILLARDFDADADTQEFWFYPGANCPVDETYCLLDDLVPPTIFVSFNRDAQNCLDVDDATINMENKPDLNLPSPPCVVSPKASLPVQISPDLSPITFYQGQFAAQYQPDDQDPEGLFNGILFGFIPKTEAEMIEYTYGMSQINLWSVVRGSDHPKACAPDAGHTDDVDYVDLDPNDMVPAEMGVFLYLNFTAVKIDFYAPPPP